MSSTSGSGSSSMSTENFGLGIVVLGTAISLVESCGHMLFEKEVDLGRMVFGLWVMSRGIIIACNDENSLQKKEVEVIPTKTLETKATEEMPAVQVGAPFPKTEADSQKVILPEKMPQAAAKITRVVRNTQSFEQTLTSQAEAKKNIYKKPEFPFATIGSSLRNCAVYLSTKNGIEFI